ncbi:dipeptidylpeptidase [Dipsacomyces acuminosporus]|nr:dipeptidylpeptidase [Dipsacomyces acuminosporus]
MSSLSKVLMTLPAAAFALGALARPFTPEDLVQTNRFSGSTAISPNSTAIAYIQTRYSIDSKKQSKELYIQKLDSSQPFKGLDPASEVTKPSQPLWLSETVLGFVATNPKSGESGLYAVENKDNQWTKPSLIYSPPVDISDIQFNPQSGVLAFTAQVYDRTSTLEETAELDRKDQARADTGQVYDELWIRHWDTFVTPKLPQIHTLQLVRASNGSFVPKGSPKNIIKDTKADGRLEVASGFTFSPNGRQIAFVSKKPGRDYAWKTTSYVYLADVDGSKAVSINPGNGGASASPVFNEDGTKIAFLHMAAPSYESDRNQIKIYDIKKKTTVNVATNWDRSPSALLWVDRKTLLAQYNDFGRVKLAKVDIATGRVTPLVSKHAVGSAQSLPGTDKLLINYSAIDSPPDLYTVSIGNGDIKRVSSLNPQFNKEIFLSQPEDVEFVGADNAKIHGYIIRPPNFDAKKKYPLAFIIHGGPQSSFTDSWSTRWNLNIFAGAGFVTVALDPQGSTGYGQNFTDSIRNQWGGKPYQSLILSLKQLLDAHPYIDCNRLAALGASYGGYMINWINGHNDIFKALVNHDGMFSTISSYYSTEELYFPETEFEGVPFDAKARKNYERWSPEQFVKNWKTPTLVIHSEKDYRLLVGEGISTFTALRRQNVPARFLYFPDENHWVLKPANSLRWNKEVLGWITKWTSEKAPSKRSIGGKFHIQNAEL